MHLKGSGQNVYKTVQFNYRLLYPESDGQNQVLWC
jgi:hypothetical protein